MRICFTILYLLMIGIVFSQEIPDDNLEKHLEDVAEKSEQDIVEDSYLEEMQQHQRHRLNLNTVTEEELNQLRILTAIQIKNLINYRSLLGKLISVYELQAVPGWDIPLIKKLLSYITATDQPFSVETFSKQLKSGEHSLMFRLSRALEKPGAYKDTGSSKFIGSPQGLLVRYRYNYKNLLQFGLVAEKDAGEPLFKGHGFDFYSFYFFIRNPGLIKSLAIGDYQVNMGQGLVQWLGMAFTKTSDVLAVKRQDEIIKPYRSSGEFYFHRGIALTIKKGNWQSTAFLSLRSLSANVQADSLKGEVFISSFATSGYHRSAAELADKNKVKQFASGGNLSYTWPNGHLGLNLVHFNFSIPIEKQNLPYNLHAFKGKTLSNGSIDYDYTYKNFHVFGELAADHELNKAFLNGVLVSLDQRLDLTLLYRNISAAFQSINGNAFTENTNPVNEKGIYAGISFRASSSCRMEVYSDIFLFPWLKYRVEAPSGGKDFLLQLHWQSSRSIKLDLRYKYGSKQGNEPTSNDPISKLTNLNRKSFRLQLNWEINKLVSIRQRIETTRFKNEASVENGFLSYFDLRYHPPGKKYSFISRLQFFETGGFDSRIYAYENDVGSGVSIPVFSGKGMRYYLDINLSSGNLLHKIFSQNLNPECWIRWAQTVYASRPDPGYEGKQNLQSEIKFQFLMTF